MISLSDVVWKIEPSRSRFRLIWPALTRLPLCASATAPHILTFSGCAPQPAIICGAVPDGPKAMSPVMVDMRSRVKTSDTNPIPLWTLTRDPA